MAVKTETPKTCEWCGETLSPEEIEYPAYDAAGNEIKGICSDCFHDHYEFTCDRCCEYELEEHQHNFLVVHEEVSSYPEDVQPGIYEIVKRPYYGQEMIGSGSLYGESLRKTDALIDWKPDGWYPCGHLCRDCVTKLGLKVNCAENDAAHRSNP